MADSQSNVNKINLIAPINVDPIGENVWGFDEEAQHVQNTGFVFDNGIANLYQRQVAIDNGSPSNVIAANAGMFVTSTGEAITNAALSDIDVTAPLSVAIQQSANDQYPGNAQANIIDYVSSYGVVSSFSIGGLDDVAWGSASENTAFGIKAIRVSATSIKIFIYTISVTTGSLYLWSTTTITNSSTTFQIGIVRKSSYFQMSKSAFDFWINYTNDFSSVGTFELYSWVLAGSSTLQFSGAGFYTTAYTKATTLQAVKNPRMTVIQFYNTNDYVVGFNGYKPGGSTDSITLIRKAGAAYTTISTTKTNTQGLMFIWHQCQPSNNYNAVAFTTENAVDLLGYSNFNSGTYNFPAAPGVNNIYDSGVAGIGANISGNEFFYNLKVKSTTDSATVNYLESKTISKRNSKITDTAYSNANAHDAFQTRAVLSNASSSTSSANGFVFCASFTQNYKTKNITPLYISVAQCISNTYANTNMRNNVLMGVPISDYGSYDISFMPMISPDEQSIIWADIDGTFKYVKIGQVYSYDPINPTFAGQPPMVQKISNNLYKINTIDPINIVDITTKSMTLGSNDFSGQMRTISDVSAAVSTTTGGLSIQTKYANSLDLGLKTVNYIKPAAVTGANKAFASFTPFVTDQTVTNGFEINPITHVKNYFYVQHYDNGRAPSVPVGVPAFDCYGSPVGGWYSQYFDVADTYYAFEPFLNEINQYATYVQNTAVPLPLGTIYSGFALPNGSSAYNPAYSRTYITSGFYGTTPTSDYDGRLLTNYYPFSAQGFTLFSQGYVFDGKAVYQVSFGSGNFIQLPPVKVIDAVGLRFIGLSPTVAFFYSDMDRSLWAFDGGRTMTKVKKLDGFPKVTQAMYNTRDDALLLETGTTGFLWYREGRTTWQAKTALQSVSQYLNRMFDTKDGLIFGNNSYYWHYSYFANNNSLFPSYDYTIFPLTLQTGYIGPSSNQRMILSAVTFGIYNEDRTALSFQVQMIGYDQDKLYTMSSQTFNVQPADYINGGIYRARIQDMNPQRVLAASFKLSTTSKIRVFELQYHWKEDVQAIYSGGRSK